uniref:CLIP domain-containing serine protease n=1 Tax=Anopheles merus TaxID=30066 RepID=A0A182V4G1_ANOME
MMLLGGVKVLRVSGAPLLFVLLWMEHSVFGLDLNANCVTPLGESGKCILFRECQPLITIYNKPINTHDDTQLLTQSRCGMLQRKTLVCCPVTSQARSSLPEPPVCGIHLADRVIGGQPTQIDEFPWTALIEFQKPDDSFGFHCGGSLINERYIVTAAHCIKSIPRGWKVLPLSSSLRNRNHVGMPAYAAGWGKTESATASEKKLKVEMNIKSLQECAPVYQRGGILLKQTHMCAGGVRGKDTCSGDSGGPLMRQMTGSWYLIGVVSFGPQKCGTYGVPGVYTNVAEYVDWIKDNIY